MQSTTKKEDKYTIRVYYMPDGAVVQSVTIWNDSMTGEELGKLVETLSNEYHPMKFVIIDHE